jgi:hypothetical protein
MAEKYCTTYHSRKEDAFLVHTNEGVIMFARTHDDGLYAYTPSVEYREQVAESNNTIRQYIHNVVATVRENSMGYTQRQFERAKKARRLYHIVSCPTITNFKHILLQNIIKNCPVTAEDVNIAKKIFGGDIGTLKGKSTRHRPTPVIEDLMDIPPELLERQQNLTYCMDMMYVNGMPMLIGIYPAKHSVQRTRANDKSSRR